jgi:hypothetical protein
MTQLTLELIDRCVALAKSGEGHVVPLVGEDGRNYYTLTMSAKVYANLVMLRAKADWKARYRAERLARRQP